MRFKQRERLDSGSLAAMAVATLLFGLVAIYGLFSMLGGG